MYEYSCYVRRHKKTQKTADLRELTRVSETADSWRCSCQQRRVRCRDCINGDVDAAEDIEQAVDHFLYIQNLFLNSDLFSWAYGHFKWGSGFDVTTFYTDKNASTITPPTHPTIVVP